MADGTVNLGLAVGYRIMAHDPSFVCREAILRNWTEAEAQAFCVEYMGRSQVFSLCGQVPNARPESFVDTCAMDVMITGDTDWALIARDAMQGACLSELQRNTTLRESSDNSLSIAEIIENIACPSNCSSQGNCIDGTCICDENFGGCDCSLNMTLGPTISGILDNGLCDEQEMECDQAYVFGHPFTYNINLTCRLEEFSIAEDGTRLPIKTHYTPAEFETIIEVVCPLHLARTKRSAPTTGGHEEFVFGFTVSVSNNGQAYEEGKDVFVYNSECQLVYNVSSQFLFSLKEGYCFIDSLCVLDGRTNPSNNCSICDSAVAPKAWSDNPSGTECLPPSTSRPMFESEDPITQYMYLVIIAGVIGAIIIISICAVIICRSVRGSSPVEN